MGWQSCPHRFPFVRAQNTPHCTLISSLGGMRDAGGEIAQVEQTIQCLNTRMINYHWPLAKQMGFVTLTVGAKIILIELSIYFIKKG